ncbi:MAG: OmpH family outer membrane protein [Prevotellaceae bacterium]|jgi:outer membrane protein|nr:OmpH family outer membrane protein [Prevotellaceae bacterium]
MKKTLLIISVLALTAMGVSAQKYAMVDMQYILKNVPSYESATEQLNLVSKKWQQEVDAKMQDVQTLYKNYQTELVFLSEEMKVQREEEIVNKEKAAQELKKQYFGVDGELFKKRESLMKPIQDEIYAAIQEVAKDKGFDMIFDKSSSMNIIYFSSKLDVSDDVLQKLGYAK